MIRIMLYYVELSVAGAAAALTVVMPGDVVDGSPFLPQPVVGGYRQLRVTRISGKCFIMLSLV